MKLWDIVFRVIILIMGVIVIAFNGELYIYCKQERVELNSVKDKQDVEAEFNSNKFRYQEDQIERLSKSLEDARRQIDDQKDALADQKDTLAAQKEALASQKDSLLQEVEKRQELDNENKGLQTSLTDIRAEGDALKQESKEWQRDYVAVLARLGKKMDNSEEEMKSLENNLMALNIPELKAQIKSLKADLEKISHPPDNNLPGALPDPDKKIEYENKT